MKKAFLIRFVFLAVFFAALVESNSSAQPFNGTWKSQEIANLEKGEIVIRNIQKAKNISILPGTNEHSDKMIQTFQQLDPSYLAEIIYKMPKKGNESIIDQAVAIFSDISLYKQIIYTDDRKGKAEPLFPTADVIERKDIGNQIIISTHLQMDMLSDYDSRLVIKNNQNGFFFEQRNVDPLKWRNITAVKSGNMVASICCFEYGDSYYVYALGGINAPRIPLLVNEINRQFIGRIEDFTIFYIRRFDIRR